MAGQSWQWNAKLVHATLIFLSKQDCKTGTLAMPAKLTIPSKFQLGSQIFINHNWIYCGKEISKWSENLWCFEFCGRQHDDDDGSSAPAHSSGCGQGVIWFTMKPPDSLATTKTKIQQNSDTIHFLEIFNFLFLLDR